MEIHRLALMGGERAIAEELANSLAGHWNRADQYRYREVIELATHMTIVDNALLLHHIGYAYDALGEQQAALGYYEQALPLSRAVGDRWQESITRYNMAMVYVAVGRLAEAVTALEQVVALDEAIRHPDLASDRAMLEKVRAQLADEAA